VTIQWQGCYDLQWASVITPASMAHPAKYSRGLIERIYRHCLERGYLHKGDIVGDCFGGVGTGGIMAAYAGLRWVGVELEPRFVAMARENFERHWSHYQSLALPQPQIIQGDSRKFDELIGQTCGVVSSPPFTQGYSSGGGINVKGYGADGKDKVGSRTYQGTGGDRSEGNIETLPAGDVAAVVSSEPYVSGGHHADQTGAWNTNGRGQGGNKTQANYGETEGQIGRLKAVVSSPPYQEGLGHDSGHPRLDAKEDARRDAEGCARRNGYGYSEAQIQGETYWQAVRDVYAACFRCIKPGGVMVLVLKDYVKQRKRVPLADDTATLCESLGFVLIERIQAMLVSETRHGDLFTGEDVKTKSRKSFFRRLAESKGSPKIDHEDVLIFQRP
jgi:hypothetical protein